MKLHDLMEDPEEFEEKERNRRIWEKEQDDTVIEVKEETTFKTWDTKSAKKPNPVKAVNGKIFKRQTAKSVAEDPEVLEILEVLMNGDVLDKTQIQRLDRIIEGQPKSTVDAVNFTLSVLSEDWEFAQPADDLDYTNGFDAFQKMARLTPTPLWT